MPETLKLEPQQAKLTFLLPTTYTKTKSIAQHFRKHKKKRSFKKLTADAIILPAQLKRSNKATNRRLKQLHSTKLSAQNAPSPRIQPPLPPNSQLRNQHQKRRTGTALATMDERKRGSGGVSGGRCRWSAKWRRRSPAAGLREDHRE